MSDVKIAYNCIRQRNITAHQKWMIRSYALTLAALTLRIYLPAFLISGTPFKEAYPYSLDILGAKLNNSRVGFDSILTILFSPPSIF
jgi:hypothetical protein